MSADARASVRPEPLVVQFLANGGGEAATRLAQLVSLGLAGWCLGVEGLAVIGPSWSLAAITLGVVQSGPDWGGLRSLSLSGGSQEAAAQTVADVMGLKLFLILASVPVLFAVQMALGHGDEPSLRQLAAQIGAMAFTALGHTWVFRGLDRTVEMAVNRFIQAVTYVAVLALLLLVWREPLAVPVAEGCAAFLALVLARRRLGVLCGASASLRRIRPIVAPVLAFGAASTLTILSWLAPILAAARWSSAEEISHLTGVLRLIIGLQGVIGIVMMTVFPSLARLYDCNAGQARIVLLAMMVQLGAGMALAVAVLGVAAPMLIPAVLGPEFAPAVPLFRSLVPVLVPIAVSSPLVLALTARGRASAVVHGASATALAMMAACATVFCLFPSVWSAMVMHPVLWGQAVLTMVIAARNGVFSHRAVLWALLCNPVAVGRLLRNEPVGVGTVAIVSER